MENTATVSATAKESEFVLQLFSGEALAQIEESMVSLRYEKVIGMTVRHKYIRVLADMYEILRKISLLEGDPDGEIIDRHIAYCEMYLEALIKEAEFILYSRPDNFVRDLLLLKSGEAQHHVYHVARVLTANKGGEEK